MNQFVILYEECFAKEQIVELELELGVARPHNHGVCIDPGELEDL